MALPYENATAGEKALGEIQKLLRGFGCSSFGSMVNDDDKTILVQFKYRSTPVSVKASIAGYAAAWLKAHAYSNRMRITRQQHERKALDIASIAVYSILRDWIKGQIMAIETGVLSFEGAFLGQIMLSSGQTILEHASQTKLLLQSAPE